MLRGRTNGSGDERGDEWESVEELDSGEDEDEGRQVTYLVSENPETSECESLFQRSHSR